MGKGGGSVAAAFFCLVWYFLSLNHPTPLVLVLVSILLVFVGTWSSWGVERFWGKDNKKVVVDELAGMSISLLFIETSIASLSAGFILFRFFDITKPFYIRKTEELPGGYGVMMDDILAGIYSNLLLHLAVKLHVF